jgi:hypothetical protein
MLRAIDRALWCLPRRARRALVAPILLPAAMLDAVRAGCEKMLDTWREGMSHVDERP